MIIEWQHVKEFIVIAFSAVLGWIGFKAKQRDNERLKHEGAQDDRLMSLEKRLNSIEKHGTALEERTKSIQNEISDLKRDLSDDFKELKYNIAILISKVMK